MTEDQNSDGQEHGDGQADEQAAQAVERVPKQRTAFVRAKAYPNGCTGPLRHEILQVLGVLKAATVKQIWQLAAPHHEFPNSTASALRDLKRPESRLTETRGTLGGPPKKEKMSLTAARAARPRRGKLVPAKGANAVIWGLTELGLDAAAATLPVGRKVGSRARSLGRGGGAPHAMAVNDTIVAFTGANTPGGPIGEIADWTTEESHPLPAGRQQIADAVLCAPADGVPVLLVEVDLHNGDNAKIARKFDGYAEYFALTYKDPHHDGHPSTAKQLPTWRRKYPTAPRGALPPIALVLAGAGPCALNNTIDEVQDLAGQHWQPRDDFDFTGRIPILACHLDALKAKGPHAAIWWRFGSHQWQTLADALANTDYLTRTHARIAAEEKAAQDEENERLEATRCPGCNRREDEYDYKYSASDGTKLCTDCQREADATRARSKLLAAWEANAAMHPCYTCKGSIGGKPGSPIERREPADRYELECPDCDSHRRLSLGKPLILPMPTGRDRRQHKAGKLDDPWWHIRLLHAEKYPDR
ncbi:replication-relaxation family protein [Kitasatospora acidiphila]|uniref:replication-relaxation family protein n=1 Tax=Kitasatospora acidiphila TaxID=2567942 RepID=UPI003C7820D5